MTKNANNPDRVVRLIIGLLLMWLISLTNDDLLLSMIFGLFGIYVLITAMVGICPFYRFLGLSSCKKKTKMH